MLREVRGQVSLGSGGPVCRFVVWNDMHIKADIPGRPPWYPGANRRAFWARDQVVRAPSDERPDFVLSVGDIIDGGIDDYNEDFRFLHKQVLSFLPVPFLPCLGNHENGEGEGSPEKNEAYDHWFGREWHNYVFRVAGLGFIVLDTSAGHRRSDSVTDARVRFCERALCFLKGSPVVLVTHTPLVPMREEAVIRQSFGFDSWKVQDEHLLQIVRSSHKVIVAVLSGHLHLTAIRRDEGICHILASGTGGYPADIAFCEIYEDRFKVQIRSLPDHLQNREANIHGRPRHGVDYTDSEHPDHHSYLFGNADEREAIIPLPTDRPNLGEGLQVFHEIGPGDWMPVSLEKVPSGKSVV